MCRRPFAEQRQQNRTGAGVEVGDAQRTAAGVAKRRERRLDNSLGFRPGHQRVGVERERKAPEFFRADDPRDRLAIEAALRDRGDRGGFFLGETAVGLRRQRGMVERKRVADQDARVEIGRIEPGIAELPRKTASRGRDGEGCVDFGGRHHDNSDASNSA